MKQKRGITLVALVVTIIILLILAGVSINMLFGNEGIFSKTQMAAQKYQNAIEQENYILAQTHEMLNNRDTVTIDKAEYEDMKAKINSLTNKSIMTVYLNANQTTISNPETVKFNQIFSSIGDGFELLTDGTIKVKKDISHIKISAQAYCGDGFAEYEVPSIRIIKNDDVNKELSVIENRAANSLGYFPLYFTNLLLDVQKNDTIKVQFKANDIGRIILGYSNKLITYFTIEEV